MTQAHTQANNLLRSLSSIPAFPKQSFFYRLYNKVRLSKDIEVLRNELPRKPTYGKDADSSQIDNIDVTPLLETLAEATAVSALGSLDSDVDLLGFRNCTDVNAASEAEAHAIASLAPLLYGEHVNWYLRSLKEPDLVELSTIPGIAQIFATALLQSEFVKNIQQGKGDLATLAIFCCDYLERGANRVLLSETSVFQKTLAARVVAAWSTDAQFCARAVSMVFINPAIASSDMAKHLYTPRAAGQELWKSIYESILALWRGNSGTWVETMSTMLSRSSSHLQVQTKDIGKGIHNPIPFRVTKNKDSKPPQPENDTIHWKHTTYSALEIASWVNAGHKTYPALITKSAPTCSETKTHQTSNASTKACFVAGTQVTTLNGLVPIEQLQTGSQILSKITPSEIGIISDIETVKNVSPFLVSINNEPAFFTASTVFQTTKGPRAFHPYSAMEHGDLEVGVLRVGHVIYRLNAESKTYEKVVIKSLKLEHSPSSIGYNVQLRSGHTSLHVNGYLVDTNESEFSIEGLARIIATFPRAEQMAMLKKMSELQPLFKKFGVNAVGSVLRKEIKDVHSGKRITKAKHGPAKWNLQQLRRSFQLVAHEPGANGIQYLPSVKLDEGDVIVDGVTLTGAVIDPRTRAVRWTRKVAGSPMYEHARVFFADHANGGDGAILYCPEENPKSLNTALSNTSTPSFLLGVSALPLNAPLLKERQKIADLAMANFGTDTTTTKADRRRSALTSPGSVQTAAVSQAIQNLANATHVEVRAKSELLQHTQNVVQASKALNTAFISASRNPLDLITESNSVVAGKKAMEEAQMRLRIAQADHTNAVRLREAAQEKLENLKPQPTSPRASTPVSPASTLVGEDDKQMAINIQPNFLLKTQGLLKPPSGVRMLAEVPSTPTDTTSSTIDPWATSTEDQAKATAVTHVAPVSSNLTFQAGTTDGYQFDISQTVWPVGQALPPPSAGPAIPFGELDFTIANTGTTADALYNVVTIPVLDQLLGLINQSMDSDKSEQQIVSLYSSVVTVTHDANGDGYHAVVTLDKASHIAALCDISDTTDTPDAPYPFNVTFTKRLDPNFVLPFFFETLDLKVAGPNSQTPMTVTNGAAYAFNPDVEGFTGDRYEIINSTRQPASNTPISTPASSTTTSADNTAASEVTTTVQAASDTPSVFTLMNFDWVDKDHHDKTQYMLQQMMYYQAQQAKNAGEPRSNLMSFVNFPQADPDLDASLGANLDTTLANWLKNVYTPAYVGFMITQNDDVASTHLTPTQIKQILYWFTGHGADCLANTQEYTELNKIASIAALKALYFTGDRAPLLTTNPSQTATMLWKNLTSDVGMKNIYMTIITDGGTNILNKYANLFLALDYQSPYPPQLFDAFMGYVTGHALANPFPSGKLSTTEIQAQWLDDAMQQLIAMALARDPRLPTDVADSITAEVTQWEKDSQQAAIDDNNARAVRVIAGNATMGTYMAEYMNTATEGLSDLAKGWKARSQPALTRAAAGVQAADAATTAEVAAPMTTKAKVMHGFKAVGFLAATAYSVYATVEAFMQWDNMDDIQRALLVVGTLQLVSDTVKTSLSLLTNGKFFADIPAGTAITQEVQKAIADSTKSVVASMEAVNGISTNSAGIADVISVVQNAPLENGETRPALVDNSIGGQYAENTILRVRENAAKEEEPNVNPPEEEKPGSGTGQPPANSGDKISVPEEISTTGEGQIVTETEINPREVKEPVIELDPATGLDVVGNDIKMADIAEGTVKVAGNAGTLAAKWNMAKKWFSTLNVVLNVCLTICMTYSLVSNWKNLNTVGKVLMTAQVAVQTLATIVDFGLLAIGAGLIECATLSFVLAVAAPVLAVCGIALLIVLAIVKTDNPAPPPEDKVKTFIEDPVSGLGVLIQGWALPPDLTLAYTFDVTAANANSAARFDLKIANTGTAVANLSYVTVTITSGSEASDLITGTITSDLDTTPNNDVAPVVTVNSIPNGTIFTKPGDKWQGGITQNVVSDQSTQYVYQVSNLTDPGQAILTVPAGESMDIVCNFQAGVQGTAKIHVVEYRLDGDSVVTDYDFTKN